MDICGACELWPIMQYRWQLLKDNSSEVYVKAGDDDWTFLKQNAIQAGEALTHIHIFPNGCDMELTVDVENVIIIFITSVR